MGWRVGSETKREGETEVVQRRSSLHYTPSSTGGGPEVGRGRRWRGTVSRAGDGARTCSSVCRPDELGVVSWCPSSQGKWGGESV